MDKSMRESVATPGVGAYTTIPAGAHFVVAHDLGLNTLRVKGYSHVDLDLGAGQVHALCGEDKAGKAELLLTLAGRMHRTEGSLRVAGIDADTLRGVNQLRRKASLGFFDNVNEVEHVLSVRTVTAAELSIAGKPANRAATQEFLRAWGLDGVSRSNIESLTSYDYHLLGIALGMAWDPELLAVSDVERDLTEHQSLKLVDVLRGIAREKGVCVVCGVTDYDLAQTFDTVTCLTDTARAQQAAYLRKHGSVVEGQNAGRNGRANRDERAA